MKPFAAIALLVGLMGFQSARGQNPIYFPAPAGVADKDGCQAAFENNPALGLGGRIILEQNVGDEICIYFPSHKVWRKDRGVLGKCRGRCCPWYPPGSDAFNAIDELNGSGEAAQPVHQWFASLDGTCDNVAAAETTPVILYNAPADGEYPICIKPLVMFDGKPVPPGLNKFHKIPYRVEGCGGKDNWCCLAIPTQRLPWGPPPPEEGDDRAPRGPGQGQR